MVIGVAIILTILRVNVSRPFIGCVLMEDVRGAMARMGIRVASYGHENVEICTLDASPPPHNCEIFDSRYFL